MRAPTPASDCPRLETQRNGGRRMDSLPTPGEELRPQSEDPSRHSLADQVPGMELARRCPCVKPAKPFKSTIYAQEERHRFASLSYAMRVPFPQALAVSGAAIRTAPPSGPDFLGFKPGDGLLEPSGAIAVAGIVRGTA